MSSFLVELGHCGIFLRGNRWLWNFLQVAVGSYKYFMDEKALWRTFYWC